MCGRYVSPDTAAVERQWQIARSSGDPFPTRFNVSPGMPVPILWREDDSLALGAARWGFIPHWWKEAKPPRFSHNARVEEAASKPMWRDAMREETGGARCLVPAQGWYEWQESGRSGDRQPFYFHRADGRLVAFAGLMSVREGVLTCAILTGASRGSLAPIHERMPLALAPAGENAWLRSGALALAEGIAHYPVPKLVNSSRAEGPSLIEPLTA